MVLVTVPAPPRPVSAAAAGSCFRAGADGAIERHYRVGPVALTLRCGPTAVAARFHDYYRRYEVETAPRGAFQVEVIARRSRRTLRRHYHVLADGEPLFTTRREDQVLPHVEWAINNLVARYLPDYFSIHAAVVAWRGAGLVCPGEPGQGKSTLAAALLARGWSYLSDEFALIDPRTRCLVPYPKALCLKAGSFAALQALGLPLDLDRVYHKGAKGRVAVLDPLAIRPDIVPAPCPVRMIVFPRYGGGEPPALEPMPRAQAAFELARASFNFVRFRARGVDLLADVVRHARCYRLRTGDLTETGSLIEREMTEDSAMCGPGLPPVSFLASRLCPKDR